MKHYYIEFLCYYSAVSQKLISNKINLISIWDPLRSLSLSSELLSRHVIANYIDMVFDYHTPLFFPFFPFQVWDKIH